MNDVGDTVNQYHLQLQYEDAGDCLELIEQGQERPKGLTQSGELLYNANKDQTQNRAKNKSSQTALLSHSRAIVCGDPYGN